MKLFQYALTGFVFFSLIFCKNAPLTAECPAINFEDLAVNTIVSSNYTGVTFSAEPQSCGSSDPIYLRIATAPTSGTSSGSKTLQIDLGCPDFSPDYLRMVFTNLQRHVKFTVGESTGASGYVFQVRWYNTTGGLLGTRNYTSGSGVHTLVEIGSSAGTQNIRRVEVASTVDGVEVIDDLQFDGDTTAPEVWIDSPAQDACICGSVMVRGRSCEPDGSFDSDMLEYQRTDAAPDAPWDLIGTATVPVCTADGGVLYYWDAAELTEGEYYLRLTAFNDCGLFSSAVITVYVTRNFEGVTLRSPAAGATVGGMVPIEGTVTERCFASYTVTYRPAAGGAWKAVDPAHPTYTAAVINDPLAIWNTTDLTEGPYRLRVQGMDSCGNTEIVERELTVIPTLGSFTADLDNDGDVDLVDLSLFAAQWLSGTGT